MDFAKAFDFVCSPLIEGGYVNDLRDPGGATKYGISQAEYPKLDILNLTIDNAREIYFRDYWERVGCDRLPDVIRLALFDCAVNQGCNGRAGFRAQKLLQQSLKVTADGMIGPKTIAAARAQNPKYLFVRFMAERAKHYASLGDMEWAWGGWFSRLFWLTIEESP